MILYSRQSQQVLREVCHHSHLLYESVKEEDAQLLISNRVRKLDSRIFERLFSLFYIMIFKAIRMRFIQMQIQVGYAIIFCYLQNCVFLLLHRYVPLTIFSLDQSCSLQNQIVIETSFSNPLFLLILIEILLFKYYLLCQS